MVNADYGLTKRLLAAQRSVPSFGSISPQNLPDSGRNILEPFLHDFRGEGTGDPLDHARKEGMFANIRLGSS